MTAMALPVLRQQSHTRTARTVTDGYPADLWQTEPGSLGFNSHAQTVYAARRDWKVHGVGPWLQPQQAAALKLK